MLLGLLHLSLWGYFWATVIMTQITIAGVTLYLHRCQTHRSLELHAIVSHFFRFWLWLTTGMRTIEWVAVHRKHHAFSDKQGDPHSPTIYGINKVLWGGTELYQNSAAEPEMVTRYGHHTPNDWIERHLYYPHCYLGIALMFAIDILLFGIPGITIWAIQMMWIPFFAAGVINGIGHYWGYRNYECADAARNISPVGFFIGGEELHNNHHTYPTSAKFSCKLWEFDIGWFYIKVLGLFGLAKPRKVPPKPLYNFKKIGVDLDTLKAVFANRFHIMAHYRKQVIAPTVQAAHSSGEEGLRGAETLLSRESRLLTDTKHQARLKQLLEHEAFNRVYHFRVKLQAVWSQKTASSKELVEALQEWCRQAEESGVKVLEDFVLYLRGFTEAVTRG